MISKFEKYSKFMLLKLSPLFIFLIMYSKSNVQKRDVVFTLIRNVQDIIVIKGQVIDDRGIPISDVMVLLKERANFKKTNSNGNFSIAVNNDETLEFSHIGFRTKTLKVSKEFLNVKLKRL